LCQVTAFLGQGCSYLQNYDKYFGNTSIDRRTELIAACRENGNKINLDINKLGNVMNSVSKG
jgi:hypothetical protein